MDGLDEVFFFEVKKDCIYSALSELFNERAGSEGSFPVSRRPWTTAHLLPDLRTFLRSHHVHFDPLGVLCYLRRIMLRSDMISQYDTFVVHCDLRQLLVPNSHRTRCRSTGCCDFWMFGHKNIQTILQGKSNEWICSWIY